MTPITAADDIPPCAGCSSPLCPDCNPTGAPMEAVRPPLGDPLAEATHYLRIYFAPGSEGARAVATMLAALDDAQRELAATKAERDALRRLSAIEQRARDLKVAGPKTAAFARYILGEEDASPAVR